MAVLHAGKLLESFYNPDDLPDRLIRRPSVDAHTNAAQHPSILGKQSRGNLRPADVNSPTKRYFFFFSQPGLILSLCLFGLIILF